MLSAVFLAFLVGAIVTLVDWRKLRVRVLVISGSTLALNLHDGI